MSGKLHDYLCPYCGAWIDKRRKAAHQKGVICTGRRKGKEAQEKGWMLWGRATLPVRARYWPAGTIEACRYDRARWTTKYFVPPDVAALLRWHEEHLQMLYLVLRDSDDYTSYHHGQESLRKRFLAALQARGTEEGDAFLTMLLLQAGG